jgi:hypothetical protein
MASFAALVRLGVIAFPGLTALGACATSAPADAAGAWFRADSVCAVCGDARHTSGVPRNVSGREFRFEPLTESIRYDVSPINADGLLGVGHVHEWRPLTETVHDGEDGFVADHMSSPFHNELTVLLLGSEATRRRVASMIVARSISMHDVEMALSFDARTSGGEQDGVRQAAFEALSRIASAPDSTR